MKFDKLNNWLTVIANFGVIIGIVFLALEMRYTRTSFDLQFAESFSEGYDIISTSILSSSQSAEAIAKGLYNPSTLTDGEVVQFSVFLMMFQNNVIRLQQLSNNNLISESEYQFAIRQFSSLLDTPGGRLYRENSPGFQETPMAKLIQPYLGMPPVLNLILDRKPSEIGTK